MAKILPFGEACEGSRERMDPEQDEAGPRSSAMKDVQLLMPNAREDYKR